VKKEKGRWIDKPNSNYWKPVGENQQNAINEETASLLADDYTAAQPYRFSWANLIMCFFG